MSKKEMTRNKAVKKDKGKGWFYAEYDEESGMYGVFGSESGFCYSTHADYTSACKAANDFSDELFS